MRGLRSTTTCSSWPREHEHDDGLPDERRGRAQHQRVGRPARVVPASSATPRPHRAPVAVGAGAPESPLGAGLGRGRRRRGASRGARRCACCGPRARGSSLAEVDSRPTPWARPRRCVERRRPALVTCTSAAAARARRRRRTCPSATADRVRRADRSSAAGARGRGLLRCSSTRRVRVLATAAIATTTATAAAIPPVGERHGRRRRRRRSARALVSCFSAARTALARRRAASSSSISSAPASRSRAAASASRRVVDAGRRLRCGPRLRRRSRPRSRAAASSSPSSSAERSSSSLIGFESGRVRGSWRRSWVSRSWMFRGGLPVPEEIGERGATPRDAGPDGARAGCPSTSAISA